MSTIWTCTHHALQLNVNTQKLWIVVTLNAHLAQWDEDLLQFTLIFVAYLKRSYYMLLLRKQWFIADWITVLIAFVFIHIHSFTVYITCTEEYARLVRDHMQIGSCHDDCSTFRISCDICINSMLWVRNSETILERLYKAAILIKSYYSRVKITMRKYLTCAQKADG